MHRSCALLLLTIPLLAGCGGNDAPEPPRPLEAGDADASGALGTDAALDSALAGEEVTTEDLIERMAESPRFLLFDLQTALESSRAGRESYPTEAEFQADDRWLIHRAALDAAFETWSYESDGSRYRVEGSLGDRTLSITSQEGSGP